jgi:dTDP-4-dehydrorhamnose reductase
MERVLVLGAQGMVGSALMGSSSPRFELVGLGHADLDITVEKEGLRAVRDIRPDVLIHAAAYTDVDGCERNPDRAFDTNSRGTSHVVKACREIGAKLVYISTDYVFDGSSTIPYREEDPVNPLSVYGRSKLEGERHVQSLLNDFIILRTQWLFGDKGKNFVTMVLNGVKDGKTLTIVRDQFGSPTYVVDLRLAILRLVERGCRGVFHVANSSSCSWYEFAREILEVAGMSDIDIIPVDGTSLRRPAPRPQYCVLNCEKLTRETGLTMRPWQRALRDFMRGR